MNKKLLRVQRTQERHWVGDGFPVSTLFFYGDQGPLIDPFLMLDHAGPHTFQPTERRLGVGPHPHRGFETVTIVYDGEVEHRDSAGGGGRIGRGDVQWMTAASGLVHEEFHGRDYAQRGGPFEMAQLWVNLPAKDKMSAPRYQPILNAEIPEIELPGGGTLRAIAGDYAGHAAPAKTFTPIAMWDIHRDGGDTLELAVPDGWNTLLVVLAGSVRVNGSETLRKPDVGMFAREGEGLMLDQADGLHALLLAGEPIGEPVVGYGPFVMNTREEIQQAITDYHTGKMGRL